MSYIVKPKVPNELKKSIQQKVADAKSSGQVKNLMHDKTIYHFPRIIIKRDDLYYNLANDRTLTKTREFVKEQLVDDDFFAQENFFDLQAQREYHKIISTFIPPVMPKVLRKTNDQRDPLFITENGIMANGNTRLSCFRNEDMFSEVECYVFPSDYSDDWEFIRQFVDLQDNAEDFSSTYPWYARAERIQMNIDAMNLSEPNYIAIHKKMQYRDAKEAELHHSMLKLANEFVNLGRYPKYSKLSDLDSLGSDAGLQVFFTLASTMRSNNKVDYDIKEKTKKVSFEIIGTGNQGNFASQHLAVSNIWSKNSMLEEARALNKSQSATPNLMGGQDINENKSSDSYKSDIFEGKNIDDSAEILTKHLDKVELIKEIATSSSMRDSYLKGLRQQLSKLNNLNVHSLKPDSNLENIDEVFKDFEELLQSAKDKINSFTSS
jgi:hypothetical protein